MDKKKAAFICVHNSCRSQIAEALGKHLAGDKFDLITNQSGHCAAYETALWNKYGAKPVQQDD